MGKSKIENVFKKLSKELPPVKQMGQDENKVYRDLGMKVFANDKDREQFIRKSHGSESTQRRCIDWDTFSDALITVATENGLIDLDDHDLRIMYSRRGDNEERVVARLVAVKDGIIKAKLEPTADGSDQGEAMRAFRRDVEVKLDQILSSIPSRSSSAAVSGSIPPSSASVDAPPAYSKGGVGAMIEKALT